MLAVGFGAMLSQAVFVRELYVAGSGNELTIGLLLGLWLGTVALGAGLGRRAIARLWGDRFPPGVIWAFLLLAAWGPASVGILRAARPVLGVGPGEFLSLGQTALLTFGVVLPVGLAVGGLLPPACEALARRGQWRVASRLYAAEALGTGLGGLLVTFVLAGRLNAWQIMVLAGCAWLLAGAAAAQSYRVRRWLVLAAGLALGAGLWPHLLDGVDFETAAWRWRPPRAEEGLAPGDWRLVASVETRHQNLALVQQASQYTMYGNGQVLFSFPDPITSESTIHAIMAQCPAARRVLLLGGEPMGDLAELLKYPLDRVVYVELDPGIGQLLQRVMPEPYAAVLRDPRVKVVHEDGPAFVRRTDERFDLVVVRAPEPVSGAANRMFTKEFYQSVRARLAPRGVVWTGLEASERLGPEARRVAASVYRTLTDVFESVRVTSGSPLQLIAGFADSPLTLDKETLYRRSAAAGIHTRFFRPDYFRQADELDPAKIADTERLLKAASAPANTLFHPVAYRRALVLWSRFSGSGVEGALTAFDRVWPDALVAGVGGLGLAVMLVCRPLRRGRHVAAMAAAGFGALTLELVLLYLIQGVQGYLYAQFGLLVALFMAGTVAGAWVTGRLVRRSAAVATADSLLALAALAVGVAAVGPALMRVPYPAVWVGLALVVAGALAAAAFVAVSRSLVEQGLAAGRAVAWTEAADYGGSMLGGLLSGILLVPVAGVGGACVAVALLCGVAGLGLMTGLRE